MRLKAYALEAKDPTQQPVPGQRIEGVIKVPEGANIIYVGAVPPEGHMICFAEVADIDMPVQEKTVIVLKDGDTIPDGYKYLGYILAVPLLFIYEKESSSIIT